MAKKKRFRNPLKSIRESSSHAPEPSVPEPTIPDPSIPEPTEAETQPSKVDQDSTHKWPVKAIDEEHNIIKTLKLRAKEIHDVPDGLRIIVDFDEHYRPVGNAAGLLASVCGIVATNSTLFPICYEKWPALPESYFKEQWRSLFNLRFYFKVHEDYVKRYLMQSINRKWREHRIKLWDEFNDPALSKTEIINNVPEGVSLDHWALFVEYRFKPETQEQCKRNKENKAKQLIPHTCGAKSVARRRHELQLETGKSVGRGPMWNLIHKRKDGRYVNDKAKEIGYHGPEHSGRVRGLGLGAVPTVAFKHTTTRLSGMNFGSSDAGSSSTYLEKKVENIQSQMQALMAFVCSNQGGNVPQELSAFFTNSTQQAPDGDGGSGMPNGSNPNSNLEDA
ncbi:uncharacterized protein LOC130736473 [Lotus japonicus]|uniref:uncharacterized protein LOC130736473 n=1 Tax=Lotus japonicus TaxID=34305 RepID=UPI00258674C5|nr:uncharacterized protein LOC130736473 [Lotus japonicus]